MRRTFFRFYVVLASSLCISICQAAPDARSIGLNFGADDNGVNLQVNGPAGIFDSNNWNNLFGANGGPTAIGADDHGVVVPNAGTVQWTSPNTWASSGRPGEENNTAPAGENRDLMTGYIDTDNNEVAPSTNVVVSGLGGQFLTDPYNIVVYIKGGVNQRGGHYDLYDETGTILLQSLEHLDTKPFNGIYDGNPTGDLVIFEGVIGSGFKIVPVPTSAISLGGNGFRAPINGIEIYSLAQPIVPEPGSIVMMLFGGVALAGLAWRRRFRSR